MQYAKNSEGFEQVKKGVDFPSSKIKGAVVYWHNKMSFSFSFDLDQKGVDYQPQETFFHITNYRASLLSTYHFNFRKKDVKWRRNNFKK